MKCIVSLQIYYFFQFLQSNASHFFKFENKLASTSARQLVCMEKWVMV